MAAMLDAFNTTITNVPNLEIDRMIVPISKILDDIITFVFQSV